MDADLRAALFELDCASLADADKGLRVVDPGIRPVNAGRKLVGVARTLRCLDDFLTVIKALDDSVAGEVLVIDAAASRRAVVGELFSFEAARRGLAGIVVDGPVRDTRTLRALEMPVYARTFCPCSGTTAALTDTQCAVECGGVTVNPGDILVGDDDGIVVAGAEVFIELVPKAREIEHAETVLRERMAAGEPLVDMLNFREHAAAVTRGENSQLKFKLDE
jgi:4-hydroxy-4-methyl-2-oxoglutarate aldolase